MKKIFGLLSLMMLWGSVSFGTSLTINTATSLQANCNGWTFSSTYYLGKTSTRYFADVLEWELSKHYLIGFGTSYGTVYNPYGVFQFQNGTPTFGYKSEIKPRNVKEVIVAYQNDGEGTNIVNHGTKRWDIAGQIVVSVSRYIESRWTRENIEYKYMNTDTSKATVSTNVKFDSPKIQDNECLNVYVGRCGDGILDNGTALDASGFAEPFNGISNAAGQLAGWEECDPNDSSHTGRGTAGCSSLCKPINTTTPTGKLTLTKTLVTNKTYYTGDIVQWRIDFTNAGTTTVTQADLEDLLPGSLDYVSSQIFVVGATPTLWTGVVWWITTVKYTNFELKPGQAWYMLINSKLMRYLDNMNCSSLNAKEGSAPNSCATFVYGNPPSTPLSCNVILAPVWTSNTRSVVCAGNNTTTSTPMSINCGNGSSPILGYPSAAGTFPATCSYSSVSQAQNAQVSCTVGNGTNSNSCIAASSAWACTLTSNAMVAIVDNDNNNGSITYSCSTTDGSQAQLQIDCGNGRSSSSENGSRMNYTCHYTQSDLANAWTRKTIQATCRTNWINACAKDTILDEWMLWYCGNGIPEWYEQCDDGPLNGTPGHCKLGCTTCDTTCDNETQCLSVSNDNLSVQNTEFLPFWWKMYRTDNITTDNRCDSRVYDKKISKDSMRCWFSLRQPGASAPVTILPGISCSNYKNQLSNNTLFDGLKSYWSVAFGSYYVNLSDLLTPSHGFKSNTLGEYKLRLDKVTYNYCDHPDNNGGGWKATEIDNVCETNFTVTRPYVIQKSAFGTTPKITNTNVRDFLDIIGRPMIDQTDLASVMTMDASKYDGGIDAQFLISSEAARISKLAVTVKTLPDLLKGKNLIVKKVPNQSIYYISSPTANKTLSLKLWANFDKPFTIITNNINLTIQGNVDVNGMFITKNGTIDFEEDPSTYCQAPQVVKGIFVAGNGFTTSKIRNDNLNKTWCSYGNLQVKWILVGAGIDTLVENRRSNLNRWFRAGGSDESQRIQRRNQIFNGASLLIEYSPELWAQLPPGADQFVNLLDVYKK